MSSMLSPTDSVPVRWITSRDRILNRSNASFSILSSSCRARSVYASISMPLIPSSRTMPRNVTIAPLSGCFASSSTLPTLKSSSVTSIIQPPATGGNIATSSPSSSAVRIPSSDWICRPPFSIFT